MKKLLKNKKGFTLIELVVVIAILAVLAGILIPSIMGYVEDATDAKNSANARANFTEYALAEATDDADYVIPDDCSATSVDDFECTYDLGGEDYTYPAPGFVGVAAE